MGRGVPALLKDLHQLCLCCRDEKGGRWPCQVPTSLPQRATRGRCLPRWKLLLENQNQSHAGGLMFREKSERQAQLQSDFLQTRTVSRCHFHAFGKPEISRGCPVPVLLQICSGFSRKDVWRCQSTQIKYLLNQFQGCGHFKILVI